MFPTLEVRNSVYERVEHYIDIANNVYDMEMEYPVVDFTVGGTTAGTATGDHTVNFNARLLVDNLEHFMEDTIPHEVAHCVDHYIHGTQYKRTRTGRRQRISHGHSWKMIMRAFGVDPSRCHSLDTAKVARPKTKYSYECNCCGHIITVGPKIHNKIKRGYNGYGHKGCKGSNLLYVGMLGKVTYKEAAQMKATGTAPKKEKAPVRKAKIKKIDIARPMFKECMKDGIDRQGTLRRMQTAFASAGIDMTLHQVAGYFQKCKKESV